MSPAPNQAIAVRDDSDLATLDDSPEWKRLWARANVMCRSALVPKALQGKPADTMAVLLACQDMGLPVSVTNLNQFHVIEGSPEPSAQLTLGLAHAAGYETRWGHNDNEVAEIHIRRPGAAEVETFSFTIDDAKRAHLLDEWIEFWPDGARKQTYVTKCLAPEPSAASKAELPRWADNEKTVTKHKDNWWNYPADMLRARVAKRAVKAVAPEVRLGIVDRIHVEPTPAAVQVVLREPEGEDDITDAEIVPGEEPFGDEETSAVAAPPEPGLSSQGVPVEGNGDRQAATADPKGTVMGGSSVTREKATEVAEVLNNSGKTGNNIPSNPTPEDPVPAAAAKLELVAAAKEAGLDELGAHALAQQCWQLYRLNGDPVSRSALDIVRKEVIEKASVAVAGSAGSTSATATEQPEATLFGGGSEN